MTTVTFEDVKRHNTALIRKALEGSVFVKEWHPDDPEIEQIWGENGLIIPPGYVDVGVLEKKSAQKWARETDQADVESWGYGEPTRRDLTKDTSTVDFVMQESKRAVFEIYNSVELSGVHPDAQGNLVMDKPGRPQPRTYRAFSLSKDGDLDNAIYFARILPRSMMTKPGDQTLGEETELQYPVQLTGFTDPKWGTAVREIWAGPGLDVGAMGFSTAWAATTEYAVGDLVYVAGGELQATVGGTSAATAPAVPALVGGTVTDGTVTWTRV